MSLTDTPDEETQLAVKLYKQLKKVVPKNMEKISYYEQKNELSEITKVTQFDYSDNLKNAVGLASTVVNTIGSRVRIKAFSIPEEAAKVNKVLIENDLISLAPLLHLDAYVCGINFLLIGKGDVEAGEPSTLVTIEDPNSLTISVNPRTRKITSALKVVYNSKGEIELATLIRPLVNITYKVEGKDTNMTWTEIERDDHDTPYVPVVPFTLRKRSSDLGGRSLISRTVMNGVDAIQRTNLMIELSRDFYGLPQKIILGANAESLKGNKSWKMYADVMLGIGYQEKTGIDGEVEYLKPEIQQLKANSPTPLIEINREYTRQISVESTVPQSYFGIQYANPASEGGARISEASMIGTCESIIETDFKTAWKKTLKMIASFEYEAEELGDWVDDLDTVWADPAILTKGDEREFWNKLVEQGSVNPTSPTMFKILGLDPATITALIEENEAAQANSIFMFTQQRALTTEAEALTQIEE